MRPLPASTSTITNAVVKPAATNAARDGAPEAADRRATERWTNEGGRVAATEVTGVTRHEIQRLLVVADAGIAEVDELPPQLRGLLDAADDVYVVTPSLPGRLAWLAAQLNASRHAADERLDDLLGQMSELGVHASGITGDDSTMTALEDAVAKFSPDHILLALRSPDHSNWQEHGLIERVHKRFGLPLTTFSLDPDGHVATAPRAAHAPRPGTDADRIPGLRDPPANDGPE